MDHRYGVETHAMVHRGMNVHRIDGMVRWVRSNLVGRTQDNATLDATAGQQY